MSVSSRTTSGALPRLPHATETDRRASRSPETFPTQISVLPGLSYCPTMSGCLLVTHGSAGDVLPFVRIGTELRARGHQGTLLTHAPFAGRAGLDFVAIDTPEAYERTQRDSARLLAAHRPA